LACWRWKAKRWTRGCDLFQSQSNKKAADKAAFLLLE
jgi:hypothetical protein